MRCNWEVVKIEDIAACHPTAMATGPFGSSISSKYFTDSGVPVIRGSNLSADVSTRLVDDGLVFVSRDKAKEFQRSVARRGDLVFTCWGTINQVGLIDEAAKFDEYIVSNKQMKVTLDRSRADPRFIYYVFSGPDKQSEILENGIGSSVPGFNLGQLRAHQIFLPPLAEQQAIADLLNVFDDRIDLLRRTSATLESISQALFKSWFIDFDPVRAKAEGREPEGMDAAMAALFPAEFEESALGLIPKGWTVAAVESVAKVVKGRSYKSSELADSKTALVTLKSFERGGGFRVDGFKGFTGSYKPEQVVQPGECVVAFTDVTQQAEVIGRAALVLPSREHNTLVASLDVGIVRPLSNGAASSLFLYSLLRGERYVSHIRGFTSGTTVLHLAKDGLPAFRFALPGSALVNAFTDAASSLWLRRVHNERMQAELSELRDALLPRLVSGKLRLPEAKAQLDEAIA